MRTPEICPLVGHKTFKNHEKKCPFGTNYLYECTDFSRWYWVKSAQEDAKKEIDDGDSRYASGYTAGYKVGYDDSLEQVLKAVQNAFDYLAKGETLRRVEKINNAFRQIENELTTN